MPKKSTSHLENELKRSESLEEFLVNNQDELSREELPELLCVFCTERHPRGNSGNPEKSGFAPLYARSQRDSIIMHAMTHEKTIHELNIDLYDHDEPVVE